jgi:hypothetical protein
MLHFMNNNFFSFRKARQWIFALSAFMLVFAACEDDEEKKKEIVHDPNKPVELISFMPDSGRISEMVILDGSNFGTDPSKIKVFFNSKEAIVLNSTGTRLLALVPRLPGDTCVVSVEINGKKSTYPGKFRYKIAASVTTIAGDGTNPSTPTLNLGLDKSQFRPVYIGVDKDYNLFITIEQQSGMLLKLNVAENSATVLATNAQGMNPRFQPYVHPLTNVLQFGSEGAGNRDRFMTLDPKEGWAPKMRFIKNWTLNGYNIPSGGGSGAANFETHYHCLYCETDGYYYTRYIGGQIVKIDPKTWDAEIIGMTNSGLVFGMSFHPTRKTELWFGYEHGNGGEFQNSVCRLDVTDPEGTFEKMSGATNGGFRDGTLSQAQFYQMRQMNFDHDGNLFIAENGNHCIRKIDTENMVVETIIGIPGMADFKDGNKDDAQFDRPHGLATDAEGVIYVSDYGNCRIRRIAIE